MKPIGSDYCPLGVPIVAWQKTFGGAEINMSQHTDDL